MDVAERDRSAQMGAKEENGELCCGSRPRPVSTTGENSPRSTTDIGGLPRQGVPLPRGVNDHRIYDGQAAEELWRIRPCPGAEHYAPLVLTAAENALLKFYLPLAREMSGSSSVAGVDPAIAEHTAEVALSQAIVGWDQRTSEGFDGYACAAMAFRLMDLPGACTEAVQTAGSATATSVAGGGIPAALR